MLGDCGSLMIPNLGLQDASLTLTFSRLASAVRCLPDGRRDLRRMARVLLDMSHYWSWRNLRVKGSRGSEFASQMRTEQPWNEKC